MSGCSPLRPLNLKLSFNVTSEGFGHLLHMLPAGFKAKAIDLWSSLGSVFKSASALLFRFASAATQRFMNSISRARVPDGDGSEHLSAISVATYKVSARSGKALKLWARSATRLASRW